MSGVKDGNLDPNGTSFGIRLFFGVCRNEWPVMRLLWSPVFFREFARVSESFRAFGLYACTVCRCWSRERLHTVFEDFSHFFVQFVEHILVQGAYLLSNTELLP